MQDYFQDRIDDGFKQFHEIEKSAFIPIHFVFIGYSQKKIGSRQ